MPYDRCFQRFKQYNITKAKTKTSPSAFFSFANINTKIIAKPKPFSMQSIVPLTVKRPSISKNQRAIDVEESNSKVLKLQNEIKVLTKKCDDLSSLLNQESQKNEELENEIKSLKEKMDNIFSKLN
jgi:peptidoglycan hydrolase CwlO-like protein